MFVWRRRAGALWVARHEGELRQIAGTKLAIIHAPHRTQALFEIASTSRRQLETVRNQFGGTITKLPRDWLKWVTRAQTPPIRMGRRLLVLPAKRTVTGRALRRSALIIPPGAAFGTGAHATTAMSLRLLEQLSRKFPAGWSMLDLGTGSGILALAARKFGAGKVIAIDSEPLAISVAKANARSNGIGGIQFCVADARTFRAETRVVTANLYGQLLAEVLPGLRRCQWLILSGILREEEPELLQALKRNGFALAARRRRGKWLALLGRSQKQG